MKITLRGVLFALLFAVLAAWVVVVRLERTYHAENYSEIEEGLWQGGLVREPPPGTGAVLNLCRIEDPYRAGIHRWEPIRDAAPAPSIDWLRRMVNFVADRRREGRTVYVHCRAGVSRSGMVVVAYEMFKNGWTRDQALAFVRGKRAGTRPNPAFMELLAEWERVLKEQAVGAGS
jgi:hypothetical protein